MIPLEKSGGINFIHMFSTKNVNTAHLSQKAILELVSDYDLWTYYLGHCTLNKAFNSPIRKDKRPSAVLFLASNNKILLKDFATGETMDVFRYLQEIRGCNYREALLIIDTDFRLKFHSPIYNSKEVPVISNYRPEYKKEHCNIMIKRAPWTVTATNYWKDYHISTSTLEYYKVYNLECYWVVKKDTVQLYEAKKNSPVFCYDFGKQRYKVYKPLEHNFRFMTNADNNVIQGNSQCAWTGDLLIITKALKDVMVLHELGYRSVALQSENMFPDEDTMYGLKARFKKCIVLFDNDAPGIDGAKKFSEMYNLKSVMISKDYKTKDIAEFSKMYGLAETHKLLKSLL